MQAPTASSRRTRLTVDGRSASAKTATQGERPGRSSRRDEYRIEAHSGWPRLAWRELWTHRELLGFFVWRDVKVRYKQTLLGIGWAMLQPLTTMIVFSVVFGRLAHLDSDGVAYPAFSLAGLLPWMLFSGGVTLAANSLVGNVNLLTKVYFPRILLPLSNVISGLLDFAVSLALLLAVLAWFEIWPTWRVLLLPLPIALVMVTAAGAGLWLAALNAQYRDIRHALPFRDANLDVRHADRLFAEHRAGGVATAGGHQSARNGGRVVPIHHARHARPVDGTGRGLLVIARLRFSSVARATFVAWNG